MENDMAKTKMELSNDKHAYNDIIHVPLSPSKISFIITSLQSPIKGSCTTCQNTNKYKEQKELLDSFNIILQDWRKRRKEFDES
jgi:hypothetical protein